MVKHLNHCYFGNWQEIKKMAELKRREKQEEREAKARVLRQIEEDKIARREKFNMKSQDGAAAGPSTTPAAAQSK